MRYISTVILFLAISTSAYSQYKVVLPGGFDNSMTESDIRQHFKSNSSTLYTDKNQLYKFAHIKLDGVDYAIGLRTYNGKLNSIIYLSNSGYKTIDDPALKLHYQKICDLLNSLNNFGRIDHVYFKKTNSDWPFSMGSQSVIEMINFFPCSKWLCDFVSIKIDEDEGKFGLIINFSSVGNNTEETLWKDIFFD